MQQNESDLRDVFSSSSQTIQANYVNSKIQKLLLLNGTVSVRAQQRFTATEA